MSNVLAQIVDYKHTEVAQRKKQLPLNQFKAQLKKSQRSLFQALSSQHSDFIFECKKASPSKGLIRENFNLEEILQQYKDYASAISVLTDKRYFQGDFSYLTQASQQVTQPILCKDFFVDEYQVYEARYYGADAILLMLSVLTDDKYQQLAEVAQSLNLDVLTEVHDEDEIDRAIALDAKIIGINNRNLKDLSIDIATTEKLVKRLANSQLNDRLLISESGINNHQEVKRLAPLVNGFLIGSSIMAQPDIRSQCKALIYGQIKICGITRVEDAITVDQNGGTYAGFIFQEKSKRYLDLSKAKKICQSVPLKYVGVFVDAPIKVVVQHAEQLNLFAIQLHGHESNDYIAELRLALPKTKIWKAIHVDNTIEFDRNPQIDCYLLDTFSAQQSGGTGISFDWDLLQNIRRDDLILAGGITPENIQLAISQNTYAVDLSSGVELSPGVKDANKIHSIFNQARTKTASDINHNPIR